ncbi:MAG: OadG family protein [Bacteroidota bacterium]
MYTTALSLLAVGMVTIFSILGLVVLSGQMLIRLVNRYTPDAPERTRMPSTISSPEIPDPHIAAILAAVSAHTHGHGQVTHINKLP